MAWLGKFDDFVEFEGDFNTKPSRQGTSENYRFRQRDSRQQQQQQNASEAKRLCDITPQTSYATLTGVIIAKEQQRSVFSKKNVGSERHLVSFTLRDSPSYFVNVTCWGNADFINDIDNNFEVGNVVQVKNVQLQPKAGNENDEKFKPWTPVSFQANLSENHGTVEAYTGWDSATFRDTLRVPTRPSNDYYTLEDISISGMSLQGEHINILAAVRRVGQIRYLTTKTGNQTKKCDVVLFDDTCPSFPLDLWQNHADGTLLWTPFETVLFVADVKITYNAFKSSMVATADRKTIFTSDPDTQEAHCLRQFLRTQDCTALELESDLPKGDTDPDLASITEVLTMKELQDKRSAMAQDTTATTHYGVLYAMLTAFNVDNDTTGAVRKICARCRKSVPGGDFATCANPDCSADFSGGIPAAGTGSDVITEYNVPVALSDHTGTVSFCHLQSSVAETLLGCLPEVFMQIPEEQKTYIKWLYLLEDCKVVFKLKKFKPGTNQSPSVQVLSLERQTYLQKTAGQSYGQH